MFNVLIIHKKFLSGFPDKKIDGHFRNPLEEFLNFQPAFLKANFETIDVSFVILNCYEKRFYSRHFQLLRQMVFPL